MLGEILFLKPEIFWHLSLRDRLKEHFVGGKYVPDNVVVISGDVHNLANHRGTLLQKICKPLTESKMFRP
jgi:hypothetical protein